MSNTPKETDKDEGLVSLSEKESTGEEESSGKEEKPDSLSEKESSGKDESSGKEEKPNYLLPMYQAHTGAAIGSWLRRDDDDDGSRYFMSEPSISEEGSEDPTMRGLALLSPNDSWSGNTTGSPDPPSQELDDDDVVQHRHLATPSPVRHYTPPPLTDYPNSPGGNTSLSSRESPFWPSKFHFMAYPPGESDQSWAGSVDGQRSRRRVDSTSVEHRLVTSRSKSPLQPVNHDSEEGSSSQQRPENGKTASKQAPRSNSSSQSNSDDGQKRKRANNFLKTLKLKSIGALRMAIPGDHVSRKALKEEEDEKQVNVKAIMRSKGGGAGSGDEKKEAKAQESADDEQTSEPPRRKKGIGKPNLIHRRTRSGDDAAAMIMTGGTDWRGMENFPAPPFYGSDEEEEGDESRARGAGRGERRGATPAELAMQASAGFAVGSFRKNQRPSQRARDKPIYPRMSPGQEYWSLSDSTLSTGMGFDGENSNSRFPSYVERRSSYSGSFSTLEIEGKGRPHSQGDGIASRRTALDRNEEARPSVYDVAGISGCRTRGMSRDSIETFEPSSADSRASSKFSWISHSVKATPRDAQTPPVPPPSHPSTWEKSQYEKMFDRDSGSSESETSYGSGSGEFYSTEDDDDEPISVQQNRQQTIRDSLRMPPSNFLSQQQKVLRPNHSPFANIGKTTRKFFNKENYAPATLSADDDKYPTFICPRCKTRQREFFSIATAPTQDSAAGYLAFYFFIYVIAALYIFGLQEGWNALDCVYFAVITLTTAGLGDFVPTSDGAKVICSIFIYFGVACIGLLLGSYLAGSLDEASNREAQANRADSCQNCLRLKALKATRKASMRRRPVFDSVRVSPTIDRAGGLSAAKMFRSERRFTGTEEHQQAVYERAEKRHKHHHFGNNSSRSSESSQSNGQFGGNVEFRGSNGASNRESENQSVESQGSSDGHLRSAQPGGMSLGVIDEFASQQNPGFSSPATPRQYSTPASSSAVLGSPVTANILLRQKHTRHQSLDIGGTGLFENDPFGRRQRLFSEDLGQRISPTIYEDQPADQPADPPPFSLNEQRQGGGTEYESSEEFDSSSSESDSSESSILGSPDFKRPVSRVKTARYVFLTLKQAVVNSIFIIAIGSTGFYLIEKMSAVDSFYFTTVLLTTVGYGDITPVTAPGKLFATVYVLVAGTVLLHNMSTISMIPLELRKRRIERAVLTQFGDQLDDASLRELATGSLVRRLQLSAQTQSGLDECTREMFALAMLVRLGKVTEHDVRMTFAAFRRLDVGNDGVLNSQDIIVGMMQKRRQASVQNLVALEKESLVSPSADTNRPCLFFGSHGSVHEVGQPPEIPYQFPTGPEATDPEHESLLRNSIPDMESRRYSSMNMDHVRAPSYDNNFAGMGSSYQSADLENGYDYRYGTRTMPHQGSNSDGEFC